MLRGLLNHRSIQTHPITGDIHTAMHATSRCQRHIHSASTSRVILVVVILAGGPREIIFKGRLPVPFAHDGRVIRRWCDQGRRRWNIFKGGWRERRRPKKMHWTNVALRFVCDMGLRRTSKTAGTTGETSRRCPTGHRIYRGTSIAPVQNGLIIRCAVAVGQRRARTAAFVFLCGRHGLCVRRCIGGEVNVGLGSIARKEMKRGVDGDLKVSPFSGFLVVKLGETQHDLQSSVS